MKLAKLPKIKTTCAPDTNVSYITSNYGIKAKRPGKP
jgi:hypothetical protein